MFACAFEAGGQAEQFVFAEFSARCYAGESRLPFCQSAGLVDDQRVNFFERLQRFGVLDQDSGVRAAARADHNRHRRGESKSARAGDDEDGDCVY